MISTLLDEAPDVELVGANDPRFGLVWANPQRVSGTPCFAGTRVPIRNLWDYLEGGQSIADFMEGFPGVPREQIVAVLRLAQEQLVSGLPPDTCHS